MNSFIPEVGRGGSGKSGQDSHGALTADSKGDVSAPDSNGSFSNWEQWDNFNQPSETEQTLHAIITTSTYDAPWPEDSYTGNLKDAYDLILGILAANGFGPPKTGKANIAALDAVTNDRQYPGPGSPLYEAASTVMEHLEFEVALFDELDQMYGDDGHMKTLLTEMTINNLSLISTVQDLASLSASTNLKFEIASFISLLAIAVAASGLPGGPVIGAVIAGMWRLYSSATGGANDVLNTTFASLETNLRDTFSALITQREDARTAIAGNWGKLSTFGGMVKSGALTWPDDTSQVRTAAGRRFEISLWQSVSRATWVISGRVFTTNDPAELWFLKAYTWAYAIQIIHHYKSCNKVVTCWANDISIIPNVPNSLTQHLFDDKALGISMTDVYVGKNGWGILPDRG